MYLSRLHLEEFRNYRTLELNLDPIGLRLIGQNGSGKTSLLESIVMLATTRSPRASTDRELVEWESGEIYGVAPYARIEATVTSVERTHELAVTIELDREGGGVAKKGFILDGKPVRAHDLIGVIKFV
ncbi:MAG TPA: AAA family ATPase, partial [Thermomicrobiales bacterium]|nr:AAA family ATPase [Thermomicrobiales bacterium]